MYVKKEGDLLKLQASENNDLYRKIKNEKGIYTDNLGVRYNVECNKDYYCVQEELSMYEEYDCIDSFLVSNKLYSINDNNIQTEIMKELDRVSKESSNTKEIAMWTSEEINFLIMPYCLDLDHQVSQINKTLSSIMHESVDYKLKTNFGGSNMTYTVLKRQIILKQLTLAKALIMIEDFKFDKKLTADQSEELIVLAHSYLE